MIIYSCIDKNEYETLMNKGILECDHTLARMPSESVEFAIAYKYMADKLRARYKSNLIYPRWGWYKYEGKSVAEQPDVFFVDRPNEKYYRLKLDVKEYLLSDFDAWHSCLNLYPLSYSEDEWQEYCYYLDVAKLDNRDVFVKDNVYCEWLKRKVVKTWDRIFDIYKENDYALYSNDYKSIQAVFWKIKKENILDVKEIMVDDKTYYEYNKL